MLVFWLRLISGRSRSIITSGCGFGLRGGVRGCGCVRRGGISNAEHQWTVVTAVDFITDDTVAYILDQSLRHYKVVQSPVTKHMYIVMYGNYYEWEEGIMSIMCTHSLT